MASRSIPAFLIMTSMLICLGGATCSSGGPGTLFLPPGDNTIVCRTISPGSEVSVRSEEHTSELQSRVDLVCRLLLEKKKNVRNEYNYPKKKGIKDECSRLLEASTMKSRRGFAIQRLMNAIRQAHADGWLIVFDTLTC